MATLPGTQFARGEPPARTGQTLWGAPPAGAGERIAEGVERLGAAVLAYSAKVQKQEQSAEYYEKKRLIDEAGWAAYNAVTGDEQADAGLKQRFESDAQAIISSCKYTQNISDLTNDLNKALPDWHQSMQVAGDRIRSDNAIADLKFNWTKAVQNGDLSEANNIAKNAHDTGAISDAEYEHWTTIAPQEAAYNRAMNDILVNPSKFMSSIKQKDGKVYIEGYEEITDPDVIYALHQRARAQQGRERTVKDMAYKANLVQQVNDMVEAFSSGKSYDEPVLEDAEPILQNFSARVGNGTLDVGDGITYETMRAQIEQYGEWYDPIELASAYASGLSTQEFKELSELNRQNAEMTTAQKEHLKGYTEFIDTRYSELMGVMSAKIAPEAMPQVHTALYEDKLAIGKQVRQAIKEGKPAETIFTEIEKHFIGETDKYLKGFWSRFLFNTRADELKETVQALEGRNERYQVIMDLMKSTDKADKERLSRLLRQWYVK